MVSQILQRCPSYRLLALTVLLKALSGDRAAFSEKLEQLCAYVDADARYDELRRVRSVTLDAEMDVWSTTDGGDIISLTERMEQLHT